MNEVKKYFVLPFAEQLLLVEALISLLIARVVLLCLHFRRIAAWLGSKGVESSPDVSPTDEDAAYKVGWAVETVSRHVPWESRCLVQALAARSMLGRRGVKVTIYFGVANNPEKPINAHAWLRCGKHIVTGGNGHERFKVLTSFGRGML